MWYFIGFIVVIIIGRFLLDLNKDNDDLNGRSSHEKFQTVVDILNEYIFGGEGKVHQFDKRSFNLYRTGENQIVNFMYSTGHLNIVWKYKYFQKEVKYEKQFRDVRNISIFQQQRMAEVLLTEMASIVERHKINVLSELE